MLKTIVHNISIWIIIVPFLVGIMNNRGLNSDSKWIFFLVITGIIPQILTAVFKTENPILNISYNLYTPVEFAVVYKVFISKFNARIYRLIVWFVCAVAFVLYGYWFIYYGLAQRFLNELVCINNVAYMLWILLLLKQEFTVDASIIVKDNPFTWYLIAFTFYAPTTLIVFALYYYIRDAKNAILSNLWIIQSISNILLYLLFSFGLVMRKTR